MLNTKPKGPNVWLLCSTPKDYEGASMHMDKLSLYFNKLELQVYLEKKRKVLQRLEVIENSDMEAIESFEQILAHEAYHVYQTLTCATLSDYSLANADRL